MSFSRRFRVVLIGDSKVGKTSLLYRLKGNTGLLPVASSTIGADFHTTTIIVNGVEVSLQIWDTAGQEVFKSITASFYRNAVAGYLVFDVTNHKTFDHLNEWITDAQSNCQSECSIVLLLVGNKADLLEKREVTYEEARDFAVQHNMKYIETSAKSGTNVQEASSMLTEILLPLIESRDIEGIRTCHRKTDVNSSGLQLSSTISASFALTPKHENVTPIERKNGCCIKQV